MKSISYSTDVHVRVIYAWGRGLDYPMKTHVVRYGDHMTLSQADAGYRTVHWFERGFQLIC